MYSIDIQCEIEAVPYEQLRNVQPGESSAVMRERVLKARAVQNERFKHSKLVHCNAMMNAKMVRQYCALDAECDKLLEFTMSKLGLSARVCFQDLRMCIFLCIFLKSVQRNWTLFLYLCAKFQGYDP